MPNSLLFTVAFTVGRKSASTQGMQNHEQKIPIAIIITSFIFSVAALSQIAYGQTSTPLSQHRQPKRKQEYLEVPLTYINWWNNSGCGSSWGRVVFVFKKRVNKKSLNGGVPSNDFEAQVIKKFNGKPSDPTSGVSGFTEGGQPLLIKESDPVSLAEVEAFVKVLMRGKAQKGIIIAPDFEETALEGRIAAMENGIDLQLLRINELLNKRYANRIKELARSQVTFEIPPSYITDDQVTKTETFDERTPNEPQKEGLKPRVFISNSNTQVSDQVKEMLDFLHYDYVMGDKEETTVPIPDNKFGLMKECDCAIINIAAAEQERRYSGLYILNSNVISEIDAAYLKYSRQVVLLVERKVELPPNLKGLKRIEYDSDDLSFNAAMDLKKGLENFKKL